MPPWQIRYKLFFPKKKKTHLGVLCVIHVCTAGAANVQDRVAMERGPDNSLGKREEKSPSILCRWGARKVPFHLELFKSTMSKENRISSSLVLHVIIAYSNCTGLNRFEFALLLRLLYHTCSFRARYA